MTIGNYLSQFCKVVQYGRSGGGFEKGGRLDALKERKTTPLVGKNPYDYSL